jgi:anti-sigma regulatory factor (Ser/Thr protein kinase)
MEKASLNKVLKVNNQIDELTRIASFLDETGEEWGLSMTLVTSLNLVLEEALTNIILYGFDEGSKHSIEIDFKKNVNNLLITIIDDGHKYDPTLKADPDITLSVDERPVGGLGIFLIKKIMDKVEYERRGDRNLLILTKNIGQ